MSWFGMDLDFPKTNESGWLKPPKNAFVESVVANSNQLVINQRFAFLMKKVDAQAIEAIIG